MLTLFDPGDLQTTLFLTRTGENVWNCYGLLGVHPRTLAGLLDNRKSQINRLVALYGHIAGADDREQGGEARRESHARIRITVISNDAEAIQQ